MLPKLDENSTKPIKDNEALHVFIFDDQETTLQKCMNMYGSRTKNNKEYWLFDTTKGIDSRKDASNHMIFTLHKSEKFGLLLPSKVKFNKSWSTFFAIKEFFFK